MKTSLSATAAALVAILLTGGMFSARADDTKATPTPTPMPTSNQNHNSSRSNKSHTKAPPKTTPTPTPKPGIVLGGLIREDVQKVKSENSKTTPTPKPKTTAPDKK